MEDDVDFSAVDFAGDIDLQKLKLAITAKLLEFGKASGEQVFDGNDRITLSQQGIT